MAFEILRNGKVFIEDASSPATYYRLHVSRDVSFSQTFKQEGIAKKTLHSQTSLFEGSVTNSANPADFSFTLYVIDEASKHNQVALDFLINYSGSSLDTFNLYYIDESISPKVQYVVENCVFTSGVFNIPRAGFITVNLSGQGTKLTRTAGPLNLTDPQFVVQPEYSVSKEVLVSVNGNSLTNILGVSLELQNNISWVEKATIHATRNAVDASSSIFPSNFVLDSRVLGGSIQQYIDQSRTQSNANISTWRENIPLSIRAGLSAANLQLEVNLTGATFTNRPVTGEVITQSYDFRLASNPADLSSFFVY